MALIQITDRAAEQVKSLMDANPNANGLLIGTKSGGCSGLEYVMDLTDAAPEGAEVVEDKGVTLYVQASSLLHLIGSEMDWIEDRFQSSFVFKNPNATNQCGCGESFSL